MAAMCPNGTVNWKQIYGEDAFVLRPPIYESDLREKRRAKQFDAADIEKRAREYAEVRGRWLGLGVKVGVGRPVRGRSSLVRRSPGSARWNAQGAGGRSCFPAAMAGHGAGHAGRPAHAQSRPQAR
jgi:hypothetical protein